MSDIWGESTDYQRLGHAWVVMRDVRSNLPYAQYHRLSEIMFRVDELMLEVWEARNDVRQPTIPVECPECGTNHRE